MLTRLIASAFALLALAALPAHAEGETPEPCPANPEQAGFDMVLKLHGGAYQTAAEAYSDATDVVTRCPDNAMAMAFAVEVLANVSVSLLNASVAEAADPLLVTMEAVAIQDNAPMDGPRSLTTADGSMVSLDPAELNTGVGQMLEANLAPSTAKLSGLYVVAVWLKQSLDSCPYSRDGQIRALQEARGLVDGIHAYANHDAILARIGQLKQACTEQSRAIAIEEIRGYKRAASDLADAEQSRIAGCYADDGVALIKAYREATSPEQAQDEEEAKTLNTLKAWERSINSKAVVACKRDAD